MGSIIMDDPQKRIQNIYETVIFPELEKQKNESHISVSFTQEEFNAMCDFFTMFAYE